VQLLRTGANKWDGQVDLLLVEGVGGLLCPLTEEQTIADLARDLTFPLLIVSRLGLGTINHTLLTVECALNYGLNVAGIICNEAEPPEDRAALDSDREEIAKRCQAPVLATVRHGQDARLQACPDGGPIDWQALARESG
jgi:dethiobiotin synthetase